MNMVLIMIFYINSIICTVFKPKCYKLCLPAVFIDQEALKYYVSESKYLGSSFSD